MKVVCRVLTLGVTADRPGVSMKILINQCYRFCYCSTAWQHLLFYRL